MKNFTQDKIVSLQFNNKRSCGLWLIIIGIVIIISALMGKESFMNPAIFGIGYSAGLYLAIGNRTVRSKLSQGGKSKFQKYMSGISIVLLFVLMIIFTLPYWEIPNLKMIWLGTLLAVGIHFFAFYFVHGLSMILLGVLCTATIIMGILIPDIPFMVIAIGDGTIKLCFGIFLLFFSKPTISKWYSKK